MDLVTGEAPFTDVTSNGMPVAGVPHHGLALSFAAANFQRASAANVPELSGVTAYSMSMWFRRRSSISSVAIGEATDLDGTKVNFLLVTTDGFVQFIFNNLAPINGKAAFSASDLDLHHLVGVYNGAGATNAERARMWLDGVELSLSYTGTVPATSAVTPDAFNLGHYQPNSLYLDGDLSDVGVWNRAISDGEARSLFALRTRWDIYRAPSRFSLFNVATPVRRIDSRNRPAPFAPGLAR